jgi:S-DNA-T family DNA segregation ATPase FtsK/SpoIIIE
MAKKQSKKKGEKTIDKEESYHLPTLQEETIRIINAILLIIATLVFIFSFAQKAGPVGMTIDQISTMLLGIGRFLLPLIFLVLAGLFIRSLKQSSVGWTKFVGATLFLVASLGIISTTYKVDGVGGGGLVGNLISAPLFKYFDFSVTLIVLFGLLVISVIIIFESHFSLASLAFWRKKDEELEELNAAPQEKNLEPVKEISITPQPEAQKPLKKEVREPGFSISSIRIGKPYVPPPIELLKKDSGKPGVGDIKANANIIKRTLQNFGIDVEMDEISIGPSVTRYALETS